MAPAIGGEAVRGTAAGGRQRAVRRADEPLPRIGEPCPICADTAPAHEAAPRIRPYSRDSLGARCEACGGFGQPLPRRDFERVLRALMKRSAAGR